jgi:hypothetical protein
MSVHKPKEATMDVRNGKGEKVELVPGMWYVGMNSLTCSMQGEGEIAQYVGEDEFYDEGCDEPTRMQDYEYIVESHMGRLK